MVWGKKLKRSNAIPPTLPTLPPIVLSGGGLKMEMLWGWPRRTSASHQFVLGTCRVPEAAPSRWLVAVVNLGINHREWTMASNNF